jgi:MFS superfamily sulfate permease-like transporter
VVLLFLTGPLANMPNAVLASVVFLIGLRLVDIKGMQDILRVRPGEFVVALLTAAVVVVVGVEQGILLAIVLSIVVHIAHSYHPYDRLLSVQADGRTASTPIADATQALPGLMIYRFGASLYYANATRFTAEIIDLVSHADPPLKWFCLSGSAMGDLDYSGADAIRAVAEDLAGRGVTFVMCDVDRDVQRLLDAYGLTEKIGRSNIYPTTQDVIAAYQGRSQQGG